MTSQPNVTDEEAQRIATAIVSHILKGQSDLIDTYLNVCGATGWNYWDWRLVIAHLCGFTSASLGRLAEQKGMTRYELGDKLPFAGER